MAGYLDINKPVGDMAAVKTAEQLISDLTQQLSDAKVELERWKRQWQTVSDERAASFDMFKRTLRGIGCTCYQPEIDLEINARIEGVMHALQEIVRIAAPILPEFPASEWRIDENNKCAIIGRWAEDGNIYKIFVPQALAEVFIEMQKAIAKAKGEIQ